MIKKTQKNIEKIFNNNPNLKYIFLYFILSRIFFLIFATIFGGNFMSVCKLFDNNYYIEIANNGYTTELIRNTAFFPIIPLIIRCFGQIGCIFINNIAFLLSAILINDLLGKTNNNKKTLFIYIMSPISFFTMMLYTEALYLLLTIFAYYLFKKRKFGIGLGIIIGLCVATRNSGSMLFFAIFIGMCYLWYKKEIKFKNIFKTYFIATIISCLYPLYLQIKFGNWKIFVDCQYSYWAKIKTNIIELLINQFKMILFGNYGPEYVYETWLFKANEIITLSIFILIIIFITKEIRKMINNKKIDINIIVCLLYTIFCVLCFNTSTRSPELGTLTASFHRYYLGLFPVYLSIPILKEKTQKILTYLIMLLSWVVVIFFSSDVYFY